MEGDKGVDFQSLKSRFQNDESLKIRVKPTIPEKPKALTSPTTKISNPLIASLNSAMENRMPFSPRVVFKDDKKSPGKRPISLPEPLPLNMQDSFHVHPELVDKKQKREGDLVKQALKVKNLPLVLPVNPVTPVIEETPQPDPIQASPAIASQSKVSTPKKKSFFNFSKSPKAEKEKTDIAEVTSPVGPVLDGLASSNSTPVSLTPIVNKPVAHKALVPPVQAKVAPASSRPNPVILDPVISPSAIAEPAIPVLTVPEPDIVSQVCPEMEILKPESPVPVPEPEPEPVPVPEPDVYLPEDLTTEVPGPTVIPDILDMDIPPPIFPEDIPDADIAALDIPVPVTPDFPMATLSTSSTPASKSPNLSRTASPVPVVSASITPEPVNQVPSTLTPNSDATSSPRTSAIVLSVAPDVNPVADNGTAKSYELMDQTEKTPEVPLSTSFTPISALSVLARAEEMAPVRHTSCDQRLLNLLEKAKRKHTASHQTSTPTSLEAGEIGILDTTSPAFAPVESAAPEKSHPEAAQAEPPSTVDAVQVPQTLVVDLLNIPPVDYEEQSGYGANHVKPVATSSETALMNGLNNNRASPVPKVLADQKPATVKAKPPPPPPRKTPVTIPNGSISTEKSTHVPSTDLQTSTSPAQPVEENGIIIPAPVDFTSENSTFHDSEFDDSSEAVAFEEPLQVELPEQGNTVLSVHEQAFLEQLNPEYHMSSQEFVSNVETTEIDFTPKATELPDSVPESPVSPSPSGTLEMPSNDGNDIYEDLAANKTSKSTKKPRKIVPMNPYVDSATVNEDSSRKSLFSRKSASPDEKELKKKEKQKEKEKEKEKEKKEQKEKEREKKEREKKEKEKKEKEKEKKEPKEKEKEKKEPKEKEKEKKELKEKDKSGHKEKEHKDKDKEKKEQKEKEREKKEQKEKEKKESELKKKFKITGEEESMYEVRARETCKGRKNDLALKAGETVSIIRTTDCPKGKWLARDSNNKYGYISVESVELDVQEMMELGKKAKVSSRPNSSAFTDPEVTSTGSRSSNPYILNQVLHQESFTDDSEEWCDDDDTPLTPLDSTDLDLNQTESSLERVSPEADPAKQALTDGHDKVQARHEALQKLATFLSQPKMPAQATQNSNTIIEEPEPDDLESTAPQDVDLQILPPPDLYADLVDGDSQGIYCN